MLLALHHGRIGSPLSSYGPGSGRAHTSGNGCTYIAICSIRVTQVFDLQWSEVDWRVVLDNALCEIPRPLVLESPSSPLPPPPPPICV
jgi:hypothetical protein